MNNTRNYALLFLSSVDALGLGQDKTGLEVHLVDGNQESPVLGVDLPE